MIEKEKMMRNALDVGVYFKSKMEERFIGSTNSDEQYSVHSPILAEVRGSRLFLGLDFRRRGTDLEPATAEVSVIVTRLIREHKILTSIDGPNDNVIVIKPPMCFSKSDVDAFVSALQKIFISFAATSAGDNRYTPT